MKYLWAAAMVLALAQPASAQMNLMMDPNSKPVTQEEIEKKQAQEKAYKDSLKKIPDQKAANDPWGDVRNTGAAASGKTQPKNR